MCGCVASDPLLAWPKCIQTQAMRTDSLEKERRERALAIKLKSLRLGHGSRCRSTMAKVPKPLHPKPQVHGIRLPHYCIRVRHRRHPHRSYRTLRREPTTRGELATARAGQTDWCETQSTGGVTWPGRHTRKSNAAATFSLPPRAESGTGNLD